jgi:hypothetical protein
MAQQAREQCISENLEAYILDKAGRDNISLTVDVTLGEDLVPEMIQIQGKWDQHIKQELTEIIEKELGVAKENQIWIG